VEGEGFEPSMDGNPPITVFETVAVFGKSLLIAWWPAGARPYARQSCREKRTLRMERDPSGMRASALLSSSQRDGFSTRKCAVAGVESVLPVGLVAATLKTWRPDFRSR
jgi:hypothetical protein